MSLLAGGMTHGQAVALVLLCVFLIVFFIVDIYLVLFLRRKNKKLANSNDLISGDKENEERTSTTVNDETEFVE